MESAYPIGESFSGLTGRREGKSGEARMGEQATRPPARTTHRMTTPRQAVLLDPFPLFLDAVEEILGRSGIEIVGKSTSPAAALEHISQRLPELLVTEIRFPDARVDGVDLLREARRRRHELRPIVFTSHDDVRTVYSAFEAGAAAYVLKSAHPDDLLSAIRQTFCHSMYLPSSAPGAASGADAPAEPRVLTRRESEILRLVAEGHSNAELARMLWVTEQTVKFHLSNIYRKLNVCNRTEASRWAQLHGLLPTAQAPRSREAEPAPRSIRFLRTA